MISLDKLFEIADRKNFYVQWFPHYCSKGYTSSPYGVVLADWNNRTKYHAETREFEVIDDTPSRFGDIFKKMGLDIDWSDEYTGCSNCCGAIRTTHDSYGWQPEYLEINYEYYCNDCLDRNPDLIKEYLQELEGSYNTALNNTHYHPEDYGYVNIQGGFENGLYGGQAADPKLIAKIVEESGVTRYLFRIDDVGQFDMEFSLWVHKSEYRRFKKLQRMLSTGRKNGVDPAINLQKALASVPPISNEPGKIVYNKCDLADGSVETRVLTPEEFVEGIKDT